MKILNFATTNQANDHNPQVSALRQANQHWSDIGQRHKWSQSGGRQGQREQTAEGWQPPTRSAETEPEKWKLKLNRINPNFLWLLKTTAALLIRLNTKTGRRHLATAGFWLVFMIAGLSTFHKHRQPNTQAAPIQDNQTLTADNRLTICRSSLQSFSRLLVLPVVCLDMTNSPQRALTHNNGRPGLVAFPGRPSFCFAWETTATAILERKCGRKVYS